MSPAGWTGFGTAQGRSRGRRSPSSCWRGFGGVQRPSPRCCWRVTGPSGEWTARTLRTDAQVEDIVPNDFGQDGDLDWVGSTKYSDLLLLEQTQNGIFVEQRTGNDDYPNRVAAADMDNDGDENTVVGSWRNLYWMRNGADWLTHRIDDLGIVGAVGELEGIGRICSIDDELDTAESPV